MATVINVHHELFPCVDQTCKTTIVLLHVRLYVSRLYITVIQHFDTGVNIVARKQEQTKDKVNTCRES
jgi:hypothetical protein